MLPIFSLLFAASVATTSSIGVTIHGTKDVVDVTLLQRDANESWQIIDRQHLAAAERFVRFSNLTGGAYQLRVHGQGENAETVSKLIIGIGERRSTVIDVHPIEVFGRATLGDAPLARASIVLRNRELDWQTRIAADQDGRFHARLWQRGAFLYYVRAPILATSYIDRIEIDGLLPFEWRLRLPDRRVIGTVRDRVTGMPVAGATLKISSSAGDITRHTTAHADGDGHFDLAAIPAGKLTIIASDFHHLSNAPAEITLAESDRIREVSIVMEPGISVPMTITNSAGHPLDGATLLTITDDIVRYRTTTASDGNARVTLPRTRSAMLYVIPPEGSFAAVPVGSAASAPGRIVVATAASSLRIVARTTKGEPLPHVDLLMRFNRQLIPLAVAEQLREIQGLILTTDEHGEAVLNHLPAGSYEFWPYSGRNEGEALQESETTLLAPIVVDVKSGENAIAVNFKAR